MHCSGKYGGPRCIIEVDLTSQTFPGIFICTPIQTFWSLGGPRTCIDILKYYLGVAVPNVLTDVILLLLPVPWIWKLVMSRSQKIALTGIFLLGGL